MSILLDKKAEFDDIWDRLCVMQSQRIVTCARLLNDTTLTPEALETEILKIGTSLLDEAQEMLEDELDEREESDELTRAFQVIFDCFDTMTQKTFRNLSVAHPDAKPSPSRKKKRPRQEDAERPAFTVTINPDLVEKKRKAKRARHRTQQRFEFSRTCVIDPATKLPRVTVV